MSLDDHVSLGCSGLRVSPFAIDTMTFGEDPGAAGEDTRVPSASARERVQASDELGAVA